MIFSNLVNNLNSCLWAPFIDRAQQQKNMYVHYNLKAYLIFQIFNYEQLKHI